MFFNPLNTDKYTTKPNIFFYSPHILQRRNRHIKNHVKESEQTEETEEKNAKYETYTVQMSKAKKNEYRSWQRLLLFSNILKNHVDINIKSSESSNELFVALHYYPYFRPNTSVD